MALALAAALAGAATRVAVPVGEATMRARYVVAREDGGRGLALPSHAAHGFSQRARLLPDGSTEVTVVSVASRHAPAPPAGPMPAGARATLAGVASIPEDIRLLSAEIAAGASDDWDAATRILTWVSLEIRHADEPPHGDGAQDALRSRVASCVGRSLLAADLLRSAGIPARTIHGLLATPGSPSPFFLHRFVESWIDGLGWVLSDPGESVLTVDARHVVIAVEDAGYDPEAQRGLRLRVAEAPTGLVLPADLAAARPLLRAERPRALASGGRAASATRGLP